MMCPCGSMCADSQTKCEWCGRELLKGGEVMEWVGDELITEIRDLHAGLEAAERALVGRQQQIRESNERARAALARAEAAERALGELARAVKDRHHPCEDGCVGGCEVCLHLTRRLVLDALKAVK